MSRRKQSRPRHVDDGINVEVDGHRSELTGVSRPAGPNQEEEGGLLIPDPRKRFSEDENSDDDENNGSDNEDICPPEGDRPPSDKVSTCDKCGVGYTEPSHLASHRKLCGSRGRILMPYDPPVEIDFRYSDSNPRLNLHKHFNDVEYTSLDEENESVKLGLDYRSDGVNRKRRREMQGDDNENDDEYYSSFRSEQRFVLNLDNKLTNSLHITRDDLPEKDNDSIKERGQDDDQSNESHDRNAKSPSSSDDNSETSVFKTFHNGEDPAVVWAMKAAEKGLFGGTSSVGVGSRTAMSSAIGRCGDSVVSSVGSMSDEVSMFRSMLFQLQQQQMMQIQMIQQMRRQLIANGINPNMLPADIDLKLMSSESLASVGAAMSGLQNHRLSLDSSREALKPPPSPLDNAVSLPTAQREASRCSSPLQTEVPDKRDDDTSSHVSESSDSHVQHLQCDGAKLKEEKTTSVMDHSERYISTPPFDSSYSKEHMSLTTLNRNPLEILQERTAASMSTFPPPLGFRSSSSTVNKSSSSSLLSSSALFASSPSLSALQKETDALKPSPLLPPLSMPMTAEDYKGYIQRGTILERSQYASDDPFFKHKCRFCHKVFGSDSALQIHVRSHTGERPFKCNICGNRFSTKGNLKVHFERHKAKYPHVKMDAIPVPEHFDKQPHLMPNFSSASLPPSVPLPPPIPRLPIPTAPQGPPPLSPHISNPPPPHPSAFSHGFGGTFPPPLRPGFPHFGLMLPPRDSLMPLTHHLRMPFPPPLAISLPPARDSNTSMEFKPRPAVSEASVIRSPPRDHPSSSVCENVSRPSSRVCENVSEKAKSEARNGFETHCYHHSDEDDNHNRNEILNDGKIDSNDDVRKDTERKQGDGEISGPKIQTQFNDNRNTSGDIRESLTKTSDVNASLSQMPLSQPGSGGSPHRTPTSVISWASFTSPQPMALPGHHISMFPPHPIPPGFPGMGLQLSGAPMPFHLTSALNHALPLPSPRVTSHSPFLSPHPPLHHAQHSPPPEEGSALRNSSVPAKTIDPSENLEQYMEVHKSETSKLEALVKNIEQKITDPNQCVICHRVLSCKSALQMHYRIHTGERPFKCKICGRSFTTKGNLKTHMGVHRAKPALRIMHQCPVCHKQFTNILVLQQHIRAHTGSLSHAPQAHFLPPYLDWPHQSPFNLHCDRSYLPPLSQSLGLSRGALLNASPFFRRRSDSTDSERNLNTASPKPHVDGKPMTLDSDRKPLEQDLKPENPPRPLSKNTANYGDKESANLSLCLSDDEQLKKGSFTFIKHEFESTFLPPDFAGTSFDTPLAALEERVKAIDSQQSQTSFQKFRNSMGLDCVYFPNSSRIPSRQNSDSGSDSASKPMSPALGTEAAQEHSPFGRFDKEELTCKICFQVLESQGALHLHYRSHDKLVPLQCHLCDKCFNTGDSLHEHLASHGVGNSADKVFHGNSDDTSSDSQTIEDNDDVQETGSDKYPLEKEETFSDEDADIDEDEDLDDDFNDQPVAEQPTPAQKDDESQLNNNIANDQDLNMNSDESQDLSQERLSEAEECSRTTTYGVIASQTKPACRGLAPSPALQPQQASVAVSKPVDAVATPGDAVHRSHTKGPLDTGFSGHRNMSSIARNPHVPKHQCMTCMKPFSSASALQIHTRTHTGDKPFKCTVCSKAFTTRGNLKVHMGTHMWNSSPSRRGRRMSIEPPLLLSHMKDHAFMLSNFHSRHSSELFYQYPLSMLNSPGSKIPEMSGNGTVPSCHPIPSHLMRGYQLKDTYSSAKDSVTSESDEQMDQPDSVPLTKDLDITAKVTGFRETSPSKSSTSSSSSSSISHPGHLVLSNIPVSNTPSPNNNKENGNSVGFNLRNMATAPWLWGTVPCHHCGHIFPSQDSLEHHFRIHHLGKVESPAHSLTKSESHTQSTPKALVA